MFHRLLQQISPVKRPLPSAALLFFFLLFIFFACVAILVVSSSLVSTVPLLSRFTSEEDVSLTPHDERDKTFQANAIASVMFGSCNKHDLPQSYWHTAMHIVDSQIGVRIGHHSPVPRTDAFIWLGDVVYADTKVIPGVWRATPLEEVAAKYNQQKLAAPYVHFRGRTRRVLGVWDDHDFGVNDGGKENPDKDAIQKMFLDFLDERNSHSHPGLYSFHTIPFDSEYVSVKLQQHVENAFCVLLLDVRYFRDPIHASRQGDMLGETQWNWLEEQLVKIATPDPVTNKQLCAVTLIGSGVQFLLDEKPTEQWGHFPDSRDRLLRLLRTHRVERVVFLSGDVHLGEIAWDGSLDAKAMLGYSIVDATSSGLTHSSSEIPLLPTLFANMFPTPRRVGTFLGKNIGSVQLLDASRLAEAELVIAIHDLESAASRQGKSMNREDALPLVSDQDHSALIRLTLPGEARTNRTKFVHAKSSRSIGAPIVEHRFFLGELTIDDRVPIRDHLPDSEYGLVKRILLGTQKYVFPNAKFHELINLYLGLMLLTMGVAVYVVVVHGGLRVVRSWYHRRGENRKLQ